MSLAFSSVAPKMQVPAGLPVLSELAYRRPTNSPIKGLHQALYMSDPNTAEHTKRVSALTKITLDAVGIAPESPFGKEVRLAVLLHDQGKMLDPEIQRLINLPRRLEPLEKAKVDTHAGLGADKLKPFKFGELTDKIIRHHHSSYEDLKQAGLPDKEIKAIQAVTFADITDAIMGKGRNYRKEKPFVEVLPVIKQEAAKKINPEWLQKFVEKVSEKMLECKK